MLVVDANVDLVAHGTGVVDGEDGSDFVAGGEEVADESDPVGFELVTFGSGVGGDVADREERRFECGLFVTEGQIDVELGAVLVVGGCGLAVCGMLGRCGWVVSVFM